MRYVGFLLGVCVLTTLQSHAAPWVRPAGSNYAHTAIAHEDVLGATAWRTSLYVEHGLTAATTITGKVELVSYPELQQYDEQGWRVTVRRRIFQSAGFTASVEAGLLQGSALESRQACRTLGGEIRTGMAWSGEWSHQQTFMFAEMSGRQHADCSRARLDVGFGQQISDRIWAVSQIWSERGNRQGRSDKIQTELVWRGRHSDISLGVREEFSGAFQDSAIFVAVSVGF